MSANRGAWRLRDVASAAMLAAALGACAAPPEPVPVIAWPVDIDQFAGEWHGEFSDPVTGQSGSIVLKLTARVNTAYGDVVMTPGAWEGPHQRETDPSEAEREAPSRSVLQIRFVRIEGEKISATLVPYWGAKCGCQILTTFTGRLKGDAIVGTFVSTGGGARARRSGTWRAVRKQP